MSYKNGKRVFYRLTEGIEKGILNFVKIRINPRWLFCSSFEEKIYLQYLLVER